MKVGENSKRKRSVLEMKEIKSPDGLGRPLKLKDVPRAVFSGISPVAFSEMTAQKEYVEARKYGVGFTGDGSFFHYQFFPVLLEPNLKEKAGKADMYIWTVGREINQITPLKDGAKTADWCKCAAFLEMVFNNAKSKKGKK